MKRNIKWDCQAVVIKRQILDCTTKQTHAYVKITNALMHFENIPVGLQLD